MTTIAAGELADYRDGDYEPCVANIKADGKIVHKPFSAVGDRDPTELYSAYYTPALFDPNDITAHGGRTRENARAVPELFFDVDLKDYLGLPKEALYTESNDALDAYIEALVKDITEVFGIAGIPIHRLRHSGYGVQVFTRLVREDWGRIEDAATTTKGLAQRVNRIFGRTLVDPAATGVGAQLARLPGSLNRKGAHPRPVYTIATYEGASRLDDFGVEPKARAKVSPITEKALPQTVLEEIVTVLAKEYDEGHRHQIAVGASGMMKKAGVPNEQVEDVIAAIAADDEEFDNRMEAVRDTCKRVEQGLSISGYMTLCNHMSPATLDYLDARLSRFASATVTVEGIPDEEKAPEDDMLSPMPPPECFHGWFGDYRDLMAPTTEASDAYHLAASLTMAGMLVGRRAHATLASTPQFPCLYTVLVGETGSARKDTAVNAAARFFHASPSREGHTPIPSFATLYSLSTAEGLIQAFMDHQSDLFLNVGEFKMTMLKSRKETSNTLGTALIQVWDGRNTIDLPTRGKPLRVDEPFAALLGSITPDDLSRVMTEEDIGSGFANRVLFVYGEGKGSIPYPPDADERVARELRKEFGANLGQACKERRRYTLSPLARQAWDAHYDSLRTRGYPTEEAKKLAQRIGTNALRVAVCFSVAVGDLTIEGDAMEAALKFVEWCYRNTLIHARSWGANDEARLMEKILDLLHENGPQVRSHIASLFARRWGPTFVDKTVASMQRMSMIASSPDDYLVAQV
jgi:hypothetical protein